jgi:hypothetical protein
MPEVLDENQIDSADTEINVDAIIDSYEQSSINYEFNRDSAAGQNEDEKAELLSPALSESDTEKSDEFYLEDVLSNYTISENQGRFDLLTSDGQSIGALILSEDSQGFYDAVRQAEMYGRGLWQAEGETHQYLTVIFRNSEGGIECYKYSKELAEKEEERKPKEVEELPEEMETIAQVDSLHIAETLDTQTAHEFPITTAIEQHVSIDAFMESVFKNPVAETLPNAHIENSNVQISVDNSNTEIAGVHIAEPDVQIIDEVAEVGSVDGSIYRANTIEEANTVEEEPIFDNTLEQVSTTQAGLVSIEIHAITENGHEPVMAISESTDTDSPILIERSLIVEDTAGQQIEFAPEVHVETIHHAVPASEQLRQVQSTAKSQSIERNDRLVSSEGVAISEGKSISEGISIVESVPVVVEENTVEVLTPDIKVVEGIEEFGELQEQGQQLADGLSAIEPRIDSTPTTNEKEASIEIERDDLTEASLAANKHETPAAAEMIMAKSVSATHEQIVLATANTFEILNTTSLNETGIGIRIEKAVGKSYEITNIEIKVTEKITMGDGIAMLTDSVEKPVQQPEQTASTEQTAGPEQMVQPEQTTGTIIETSIPPISRIFEEDSDNIGLGDSPPAASKSSREVQSQIYAETGIRLVRTNPSYIYENSRPRRGSHSAQDKIQIDNDTQQNQAAVQLAKAA